MKKLNSLNRILEVFWLITSIVLLGTGVYTTLKFGFRNSYMFYVLFALSFLLYLARRSMRLKNS